MGRNDATNGSKTERIRSTEDWHCKKCMAGKGKHWVNKGSLKACSKCSVAKGQCFLCKVASPPNASPSFSRTEVANAKSDQSARSLCDDLQKRIAEQKREIASLKSSRAGPSDDVDMDANPDGRLDSASLALKAAITAAVEELDALEKCPSKLRPHFPGIDEKIAEAKKKVAKAKADKRAANPLKVRLDSAVLHRDRMGTKFAETQTAAEELQDQLKELQATIAVQAAAVDTATAALASAEAEVVELAAQFAADKPHAFAGDAIPTGLGNASANDLAIQEAVAKAVAAARTDWEQDAAARWELAAAAAGAERDQMLTDALARWQKEQDEADADDNASIADTDLEPAAKRQKEKDRKAAVVAKRRESGRRYAEDVHKANLKVKK